MNTKTSHKAKRIKRACVFQVFSNSIFDEMNSRNIVARNSFIEIIIIFIRNVIQFVVFIVLIFILNLITLSCHSVTSQITRRRRRRLANATLKTRRLIRYRKLFFYEIESTSRTFIFVDTRSCRRRVEAQKKKSTSFKFDSKSIFFLININMFKNQINLDLSM